MGLLEDEALILRDFKESPCNYCKYYPPETCKATKDTVDEITGECKFWVERNDA